MPGFDTLFNHGSAIAALRRALASGCLPGPYLFVGTHGVGKGALARAFAQAAACLEPRLTPFDSCGRCQSCQFAEAGTNPDIVTIAPGGESLQIWQFWERDNRPGGGVLSRTLNYAPNIGRRRVYIVERVDLLTEQAANSLLKSLEEPPPYAAFVLLAPSPSRTLPTIVSRSQIVRLSPVPVDELTAFLESRGLERGPAERIACYSEGRIGQAVRLAGDVRAKDEIERILDLADELPVAQPVKALRLAEQFRKLAAQTTALTNDESSRDADAADDAPKERAAKRQLAAVLNVLLVYYRDLLALRVGGEASERIVNRDRSRRLSAHARRSDSERWTRCLDAINVARRRLDANANVNLALDVLMMTLLTA